MTKGQKVTKDKMNLQKKNTNYGFTWKNIKTANNPMREKKH